MFSRYKSSVEKGLYNAVPGADNFEAYRLLRYHLGWVDRQGGPLDTSVTQGKALRPTLCLFACNALADDYSQSLPAAAAVELIHNFSLVHDDIQDQDRERRHQPTVWHLWGVPRALVAGNGLQSVGDLAILNMAETNVPAETVLRVSQILTESYLEMIQGQCLDLDFESRTDIIADEYLRMIAFKTGSLIRSGLEIGALLATEDTAAFQAFSRFGDRVGRVFQIRDDFLGIWGDQATTGKPAGNDIRRRKKTFPVVFALENAGGSSREELSRIHGQEELADADVENVLAILEEVGAQKESHSIVETSAQEALESLEPVALPPWAKNEVESLVEFLARREF